MINSILVPVDGSVHADTAIEWASALATKFGAQLRILHVIAEGRMAGYRDDLQQLAHAEKITVAEAIETLADDILRKAEARARSKGADKIETIIAEGNPAAVILDQVSRSGAQLIVMGRRGLGGLPGVVLGSVSSKILHLADCACLTVK